jgi:large subunit ribosomal protein L18
MITFLERNKLRKHRHIRIRKKMLGTAEKPRLCVYRSNRYIYVQAVDDLGSKTLAAASSLEKESRPQFKGHANKGSAQWVGERISERLLEKNIQHAVFDRNGYPYHGVVKTLADAARAKGLKF